MAARLVKQYYFPPFLHLIPVHMYLISFNANNRLLVTARKVCQLLEDFHYSYHFYLTQSECQSINPLSPAK